MKSINRRLKLAIITALGLTMLACGVLPPANILPPKLGLSDLGIKSLSLSEIHFTATLSADNPNAFALPLADTKLELILLGQSIATGITQGGKIEIAASKATPVPVEFTVSTAKMLSLLRQLGRAQWSQLSYQLKGETKWGALGIPLNFDRKGDFDAVKKLSELIR
jgi:LEA14-like dessication related protein